MRGWVGQEGLWEENITLCSVKYNFDSMIRVKETRTAVHLISINFHRPEMACNIMLQSSLTDRMTD